MVTFKELRRRISGSTCEPVDIYDFIEEWFNLSEDSTFYIYKVSTGAVLATNIQGFEAAKRKSSELRQSLGLKWDDIKFKSERSRVNGTIGVGGRGQFTNNRGEHYPIQHSRNYNPSKRSKFSGYYDKSGNWNDLS